MRCVRFSILLIFTLSAACSDRPPNLELQRAKTIQSRIDAVTTLHEGLKIPKNFREAPAQKRGGEFDVMQTLSFFPHLRMEDDYLLDYVYEAHEMGGCPVVYARKTDATPFLTTETFLASMREPARLDEVDRARQEYLDACRKASNNTAASSAASELYQKRLAELPEHDVTHWYLKHIVPDGSDDSFIELAALATVCDQFYLFWHAAYNDDMLVLTKEKADGILLTLRDKKHGQLNNGKKLPKLTKALFCPKVERAAASVTVSFHVFSRWGGLSRHTYQFPGAFPHKFSEPKTEIIIPYDCGICF